MEKSSDTLPQIMTSNNLGLQIGDKDILSNWMAFYFEYGPPVAESSMREKQRDLKTFISFMVREYGYDKRLDWTPRLSQSFKRRICRSKLLKGDHAGITTGPSTGILPH